MQKFEVGHPAIYVLDQGPNRGHHRPAVVVRLWNTDGMANLQVFTDSPEEGDSNDCLRPILWVTSRKYDRTGAPGTWRYLEDDER